MLNGYHKVNSILFGANYACVEFLFVLKAFKDGFRMAVFANLWKLTIWDSPKYLMQNAFFGVVKPVIYYWMPWFLCLLLQKWNFNDFNHMMPWKMLYLFRNSIYLVL